MKTRNTYTFKDISDYLKHHRYLPTYRKNIFDAFYNPRNRGDILIPYDRDDLTEEEILHFFNESNATDMPPQIEWHRFQLFMYEKLKTR
ncbi:MAG TPA: hypothetical protein PKH16_00060 [Aequorivita sp.]|nr:hypothetical protein [Aequorivita sp.]